MYLHMLKLHSIEVSDHIDFFYFATYINMSLYIDDHSYYLHVKQITLLHSKRPRPTDLCITLLVINRKGMIDHYELNILYKISTI